MGIQQARIHQRQREHLAGQRHAAALKKQPGPGQRIKIFTDDFIHLNRSTLAGGTAIHPSVLSRAHEGCPNRSSLKDQYTSHFPPLFRSSGSSAPGPATGGGHARGGTPRIVGAGKFWVAGVSPASASRPLPPSCCASSAFFTETHRACPPVLVLDV